MRRASSRRASGRSRTHDTLSAAVLIALNKPYLTHTKFTDEQDRPTLASLGLPPRVYAAGRLDHDSEGLLLLTDDGKLNQRLTDPRWKAPKTYLAQVEPIASE